MRPHIERIVIDMTPDKDIRGWLAEQAQSRSLPFLLAHADDGVIWGYCASNQLTLAGEVFSDAQYATLQAPLREATLQQARLFGEKGELLVWRTDSGFVARLLFDGVEDTPALDDETHQLWGAGVMSRQGFTLMREGEQELLHAPPVTIGVDERAGLVVRHYTDVDDQGQVYISASRLVQLIPLSKQPAR